ncbi:MULTISPECIES: endopeptidase La [Rhodomicrobium]|uniref:endopeptidase La n=1 Tax=Rhodomicrobium TaxID=1068 RepID=UPI000B4B0ABF|nr:MULTISPECIES: endopeptidase La [Rhodomicrobium]
MELKGEQAEERAPRPIADIPADAIIILPVRETVLFPGVILPITVGRRGSIEAAQRAVKEQRQIGILMQRAADIAEPGPVDMHTTGVVANVVRYITTPDGSHHLISQGEQRFRVVEFLNGWPFMVARIARIEEQDDRSPQMEARFLNLQRMAVEALQLLPQTPAELINAVQSAETAGALADLVSAYLDMRPEEKQEVLETVDVSARIERVTRLLAGRIEVLRLSAEIGQQTKAAIDERQREALLREQMAAIQRQLGEGDGKAAEVAELSKAIADAGMPPEVEEQAKKELRRLERTPEAAADYGIIRNYLDWLIDLPWKLPEEKPIDIAEARRILDEDHFGLEKIKQRIVEFLAVRKLAPAGRSPILCFVGPPGVGKTSLGQSIARAMQRPFTRIALGGVHDEAEIRGHRRTYIGALPGNIIQGIRKAKARNCVMMLDEIDKLGQGVQGSPSAALLEVLDPEQNNSFRDNYLGVPFDLSKVVFLTTANVLDGIPEPLLDRMEIVQLAGYTQNEKLQIARRFLVKRQLEATGLSADQAEISDEALAIIARDYTYEAGVRNLERQIGQVMRHAALRIAEGSATHVRIEPSDIPAILGAPRFENEVAMRTSVPGVATGLAWTRAGGDILFIEATRSSGSGKLILTGQLGDVMRESAQAALSLVKNRATDIGIDPDVFNKIDIHIHLPAGAIPKDGPSAGVALFSSLVSLLTGRHVRSDTAMTGEISLRGLVLPVGGIKEKTAAAVRAGITRVVLPARNKKDLEDISEDVRSKLEFIWAAEVGDVLTAVLDETQAPVIASA